MVEVIIVDRVITLRISCGIGHITLSSLHIYVRKKNQNNNDPQPYMTLCENCSFVVA